MTEANESSESESFESEVAKLRSEWTEAELRKWARKIESGADMEELEGAVAFLLESVAHLLRHLRGAPPLLEDQQAEDEGPEL
jgi:hypothetical protein